jgi:hypothetical protein
MTKRPFRFAWILWVIAFAAIEGPALSNKRQGDTLSENIRHAFAIGSKPKCWRLRRFVLLSGLSWLAVHLLTGGKNKAGWV